MANTLDGIRAIIMQVLKDETGLEWKPDEIDVHIGEVVKEMSEARPYEVKESVTLTASGKNEVDISSITDLISIPYGEYPVDKDPREYRNVKIFGDTATLVTNRRPSGDETAYLYCHKVHTLTESQSTLSPTMERLAVVGVVAKAAIAKARSQINKTVVGGIKTPAEQQSWGMNKLAEYRIGLRAITKQRITQFFSED